MKIWEQLISINLINEDKEKEGERGREGERERERERVELTNALLA